VFSENGKYRFVLPFYLSKNPFVSVRKKRGVKKGSFIQLGQTQKMTSGSVYIMPGKGQVTERDQTKFGNITIAPGDFVTFTNNSIYVYLVEKLIFDDRSKTSFVRLRKYAWSTSVSNMPEPRDSNCVVCTDTCLLIKLRTAAPWLAKVNITDVAPGYAHRPSIEYEWTATPSPLHLHPDSAALYRHEDGFDAHKKIIYRLDANGSLVP
jgi:hypothetical protein